MVENVTRYSSRKLDQVMSWQGRQNTWLAQRLGIDQSYVSKLRSGDRPLTDSIARQCAVVLGVPLSLLSYGGDDQEATDAA